MFSCIYYLKLKNNNRRASAFYQLLKNMFKINFQFKLLIENKLIIVALGILHYKISREKFEPEPGFEPRTSGFLARRSTT